MVVAPSLAAVLYNSLRRFAALRARRRQLVGLVPLLLLQRALRPRPHPPHPLLHQPAAGARRRGVPGWGGGGGAEEEVLPQAVPDDDRGDRDHGDHDPHHGHDGGNAHGNRRERLRHQTGWTATGGAGAS